MKIGIANDLPLAVEALRSAIALNPDYRLIWVAYNGAEAVELCAHNTPDLVLMDLFMPVMDGVEATRRIMAASPCAILIVTVSVGANTRRVFDAMSHGALDAVDTPALGMRRLKEGAAPLLVKIETIARLLGDRNGAQAGMPRLSQATASPHIPLLAIGASAGRPAAVAAVLRGLPADFPAAVVVVQHVDEHFAPGMASWLGEQSRLPVTVAREDDSPKAGTVLLAATNDHLALKASGIIGYTPDPREYVYRPSVDVFFQSICRFWPGQAAGVLLTGMGRDGALGLKAMRNTGHHTIAQDEVTCAVYGMPKAAVRLDAAMEVLPLERIAPRIVELFPSRKR